MYHHFTLEGLSVEFLNSLLYAFGGNIWVGGSYFD